MAETDPLATGARTWPCAYSCCRKTSEKQTTLRPREVPQCKESCQAAFTSWSGRAACCIKEERLPAAQGRSSSGSSFSDASFDRRNCGFSAFRLHPTSVFTPKIGWRSQITAPGDGTHPAIAFPRCTKRIVGASASARVLRSNLAPAERVEVGSHLRECRVPPKVARRECHENPASD
jgi:hypothetical protein